MSPTMTAQRVPKSPNFGGWQDYSAWADHDFLPKPRGDESAGDDSARLSVTAPAPRKEAVREERSDGFPPRRDPVTSTGESRLGVPRTPVHADPGLDPGTLVRPYTRTGGRTKATHELALETLVSATSGGRILASARPDDEGMICRLCEQPQSVAEVAARLHTPLGVARILISDLADKELVAIHAPVAAPDGTLSLEFMERVLNGLRQL
jgi:Protein of unknown function (DUF742)